MSLSRTTHSNYNKVPYTAWYIELSGRSSIVTMLEHNGFGFLRVSFIRPATTLLYHGPRGPFYQHGWTLKPVWISNHMVSKMWREIAYPFLNLNSCIVEVWEWISNFIPRFILDVITLRKMFTSFLGFSVCIELHVYQMSPICKKKLVLIHWAVDTCTCCMIIDILWCSTGCC